MKTIAMIPPSELKTAIAAMLPTRLRSAISGDTVLVAVEVLVVLLLDELLEVVELVVSEDVLVSDDVVSEEVVSEELVSLEVDSVVSVLDSEVLSAVVSAVVSALVAASAVSVASVAVLESSVESPESSVESARFCLYSVVHVGVLLGGGVGSAMLIVRAGRAWGVCAGSPATSRQRVRASKSNAFIVASFSLFLLFPPPFSVFSLYEGGNEEKNYQMPEKMMRLRCLFLQPVSGRHETRASQRGPANAAVFLAVLAV